MPDPVRSVDRQIWRDSGVSAGARSIPEETALALTYNGGTYAVMMGTPRDLRDFAIGFSISEGIVRSPNEIETLNIIELDDGSGLKLTIAKYYTPKHRSIQEEGITPDVVVKTAPEEVEDSTRERDLPNHFRSEEGDRAERPPPVIAPGKALAQGQDFQLGTALDYLKTWKVLRAQASSK